MDKIKLYFGILKYAFMQELEYKANFVIWILSMMINDVLLLLLMMIFLGYFKNISLSMQDFLITYSFATFYYGIIHWLMKNFGEMNDIIESWKFDYYLSFPINPLLLLSWRNVWIFALWDVFFGFACIVLYMIFYVWFSFSLIASWFFVYIFWILFVYGIYLIIWSLSFWFDKWSEIKDIFEHVFIWFSIYPSKLFSSKIVIFLIISFMWLYPAYFLPFKIIRSWWTLIDWTIFIWISIAIFAFSLFFYKAWLKKYSSGNLIIQS